MLKQVLFGIMTFFPGANQFYSKKTGGTDSARYCYSVWLRHLVMAEKKGLNSYPEVVAELGPGDSLGIGLAALISGCKVYYAFDVVNYINSELNLRIFDEITALFKNREPIPGEEEFPKVKPCIDNYDFPYEILDKNRLIYALEPLRLKKIRNSIINMDQRDSIIHYRVPWYDPNVLKKEFVDMIYSQAVLEHVQDLPNTYKAMYLWLKKTGFISHTIDFKSHGTANEWNGHWTYSDFTWRLIKGKRPYLLNRKPHSTHIALMMENGFDIVTDEIVKQRSNLTKGDLSPRYRNISDNDLTTSGAFIQATKSINS